MEGYDEHVLGEEPALVAGTGQKVAGGVLRGFGVLIFLSGALVAMAGLAAVVLEVFMGGEVMDSSVFLRLVIMEAAGILVMVLGSTAGAFGQVMGGTIRMERGSQFVWWLVAGAGVDVLVVLGVGLLFGSIFSLLDGLVWMNLLIVLGVGVGFLGVAFLVRRWKKRLEEGR